MNNLIDTDYSLRVVAPGLCTYNYYNDSNMAMVWDSSTNQIVLGMTPSSDSSVLTLAPANVELGNFNASSVLLSRSAPIDGFGYWSGSLFSGTPLDGGALKLAGGLGVANNLLVSHEAMVGTRDVVVIQQKSTENTSLAPLNLSEANISGDMMTMSSASTTDGSSTLATGTLVNADMNNNVTGANIKGYMAVNIIDNNTGFSNLPDGKYFIPLYKFTVSEPI